MHRHFAHFIVIVAVSVSCVGGGLRRAQSGTTATFEGTVTTEWLRDEDGRKMKLLEDFTYIDATGKRWSARKGATIDGASIPRALWWSGGPYEGKYREASVVHDFYCAEVPKTATWRAVHRTFFEAMLTSGVGRTRALVMYGAVFRHGPRWPDPVDQPVPSLPPPPRTVTPLEEDVKRLETLVNDGNVTTPEEIEALPPVIN